MLWVDDSLGPLAPRGRLDRVVRSARPPGAGDERARSAGRRPRRRPPPSDVGRASARLLHEEIDRLPERYRVPVVLCDLEGLTYEQAARQLGWPVGDGQEPADQGPAQVAEEAG